MTKKSDSRLQRDAQKKQIEAAKKHAAANPTPADPLTALAQKELAKIVDAEDNEAMRHSQQEEEKALAGTNQDLWKDIENMYLTARLGLVALMRNMANLNDRNVLTFMVSPQQFTDRVDILKADAQRFEQELVAIHNLHAHRIDDNTGPRETLAAMEIAEHYTAWQTKAMSVLDRTMLELSAMYDEASRRLMAAVEKKRQERLMAEAASAETDQAPVQEVRVGLAVNLGEDHPNPGATGEAVIEAIQPTAEVAVEAILDAKAPNPRGLMAAVNLVDEPAAQAVDVQPIIEPIVQG